MNRNPGYFDGRDLVMDGYSSRVLEILHAKYSGEYKVFFSELLRTYSKGPVKQRISGTIELISKAKSIIEEMLISGEIGKDQEKELYKAIDRIESDKLGFIDQMAEVEAFRERVEKVTETTGVSINQLNITKKLAKRGIGGSRKSGKKQFGSMMPKTGKMIGNLWEGAKVAAAGPFFPLLDIASDVAGGIGKLVSKRKSPSVSGDATSGGIGRPSGGQSFIGGFNNTSQQYGRQESSLSLFAFFNDRAYKAKWTKELIERIRKIQPVGSGKTGIGLPTIGSVSDLFKRGIAGGFGAAGLTNLFKSGIVSGFKAAGVAGAFAFAGHEMYKVFKASGELSDVARKAGSAAVSLERQSSGIESRIEESGGIDKYADKRGISKSELIKELSENKLAAQRARSAEYSGTAYGKFESILDSMGVFGKPVKAVKGFVEGKTGFKPNHPPVQSIPEIERDLRRKFSPIQVKPLDNKDIERFSRELSKDISDGLKSIMADVKKNSNNIQPVVKLPSTGNRYDAADALINMHSNGMLTLGDQ
jgi:hypothetical protein